MIIIIKILLYLKIIIIIIIINKNNKGKERRRRDKYINVDEGANNRFGIIIGENQLTYCTQHIKRFFFAQIHQ